MPASGSTTTATQQSGQSARSTIPQRMIHMLATSLPDEPAHTRESGKGGHDTLAVRAAAALLAVFNLSHWLVLARLRSPEHRLLRLFLLTLLGVMVTGCGILVPATLATPVELGEESNYDLLNGA